MWEGGEGAGYLRPFADRPPQRIGSPHHWGRALLTASAFPPPPPPPPHPTPPQHQILVAPTQQLNEGMDITEEVWTWLRRTFDSTPAGITCDGFVVPTC